MASVLPELLAIKAQIEAFEKLSSAYETVALTLATNVEPGRGATIEGLHAWYQAVGRPLIIAAKQACAEAAKLSPNKEQANGQ